MFVNLTVPINVQDFCVAEFEAAIEIRITSKPVSATWHHPAEGAEWEVEQIFLDAGMFVQSRVGGGNRWVSQYLACPGTLSGYVEDYMETSEARDYIQEQVSYKIHEVGL